VPNRSKEDVRLIRLPGSVSRYPRPHAIVTANTPAFTCKTIPGDHLRLAASNPERFYVPPFLGPKGWIALRLDIGSVDWKEVAELVNGSYQLVAPKSLGGQAEKSRAPERKMAKRV
jgi:hypothetical protein